MDTLISSETGATLARDIRPVTFAHAGHSITVDLPGWYGASDDDAIYDRAGQRLFQRTMTTLKARAGGLIEPSDVRRIRRKLKLTQAEASRRLGGGPVAFQKYEAGDILLSQAMSNLLRLLDHDPTLLQHLQPVDVAAE